jgi:hypothetical protein
MFSVLFDFTAQLTNKFNNGSSINHFKLTGTGKKVNPFVIFSSYLKPGRASGTLTFAKIFCT